MTPATSRSTLVLPRGLCGGLASPSGDGLHGPPPERRPIIDLRAAAEALLPWVVPADPSLIDRIVDPQQPDLRKAWAARRLTELPILPREVVERLESLSALLPASLPGLREWRGRIRERGREVWSSATAEGRIRLVPMPGPVLRAAPAEAEASAPLTVLRSGEVVGLRFALARRDPGGELLLSPEGVGQTPQRVRVALIDPAYPEPLSWEIERYPADAARIGALRLLGRALDLPIRPETGLWIARVQASP